MNGTGSRADFENAFADMAVLEEFHAYPGAHLLNALEDLAATDDARATAALVTRISSALLSRSFRRNGADWDAREDSELRHARRAAADTGPW